MIKHSIAKDNVNPTGAKNVSGRSREFDSRDAVDRSRSAGAHKNNTFAIPEDLKGTCWLCFPFLILAIVASGLYFGFSFAYNTKEDAFESETFTKLDVQSLDAPEHFLARYTEVNRNIPGMQSFSRQRIIQYTGVLSIESGRHLFKLRAKAMEESEVTFLSERADFHYNYDPKRMAFAAVATIESDHHPILANLSSELSHILGGFVNPINAVVAEPESYVIDGITRVVWNGEPCLKVKVVSAENSNARSTAYINERTMQTIGVQCELFAGGVRTYRFFSNSNADNYFMPDEIEYTSHDGDNLNVQLTNILFAGANF